MKKGIKDIIWSNMNLNLEDWEDYFKEIEEDRGEELTEEEKYELMIESNNLFLEDERVNLDIQTNNPIIAIADLGLWHGRVTGYKIINSCNIKDILYGDCYYAEWYSDGYNVKATMVHHDGTNYIEYREIADGVNIDKFLDKLYNQEEVTRADINRYTRSILPYVAEVYGWKCYSRRKKKVS